MKKVTLETVETSYDTDSVCMYMRAAKSFCKSKAKNEFAWNPERRKELLKEFCEKTGFDPEVLEQMITLEIHGGKSEYEYFFDNYVEKKNAAAA